MVHASLVDLVDFLLQRQAGGQEVVGVGEQRCQELVRAAGRGAGVVSRIQRGGREFCRRRRVRGVVPVAVGVGVDRVFAVVAGLVRFVESLLVRVTQVSFAGHPQVRVAAGDVRSRRHWFDGGRRVRVGDVEDFRAARAVVRVASLLARPFGHLHALVLVLDVALERLVSLAGGTVRALHEGGRIVPETQLCARI